MKNLSVYSNGRWVSTLSGVGPTSSGYIEHDGSLPQVAPGVTPLQVIESWKGYEPGVHVFLDGGKSRSLVLLSKKSLTGTASTPNGEKPTASENLTATVFLDGTGTTYIKITTTAIDGVQSNANSEIIAHMGGQWVKMTSTKGDVAFAPTGAGDIFGGAVTPDFAGLATEQFVAEAIAAIDLSNFAPKDATLERFDQAFQAIVERPTRADLAAKADLTNFTQTVVAGNFIGVAMGFGPGNGTAEASLAYLDTNEGYGKRLILDLGNSHDFVVLKSDLDPLNALLPRIESLENKAAPAADLTGYVTTTDLLVYAKTADVAAFCEANYIQKKDGYTKAEVDALIVTPDLSGYADRATVNVQGQKIEALIAEAGIAATERGAQSARITALELNGGSAVDVSSFAKLNDASQTIVASVVEANRFRLDATRSLILLNSNGQERLIYRDGGKSNALAFVSELAGLCTIADAATQIATCAKKADTYTKEEVETRLLQVPAPMKYLQWGGAFQKMPAANAKDKWFSAGLLPSIPIVKGKHYRLEMTTKFGPLNTDVKEAWVGFRFNYKALNELPCTKQPLVTMGGFGTTSVTRARAAIAATAVATTTPTRADRFRLCYSDDWTSAEDIIEYAVEFEADQDIASANFVPEICFGGQWLTFPAEFIGIVAVFRQMD